MCTVLLRLRPGSAWPVVLGAVRDEFVARPWDPPAAHWRDAWTGLVGGRDRTAGGTWLAVDPVRPAVAALLNGPRRPPLPSGVRPTRGTLALEVLASGGVPDGAAIADHDAFHLLHATSLGATVWSWDGEHRTERALEPGDHVLVNLGVDATEDPLVDHFRPLLEATPDPSFEAEGGLDGWAPWVTLLAGDGLDPEDPRALLVRREVEGRPYGSTSASLVALGPHGVRYGFNPRPTDRRAWTYVPLVGPVGIEPTTQGL
jgi:hypothetical protein